MNQLNPLKRKTPAWASGSSTPVGAGPSSKMAGGGVAVKTEPGLSRAASSSTYVPSPALSRFNSGPSVVSSQSAALSLYDALKVKMTMGGDEVFFHIDENFRGADQTAVKEALKGMERVSYNQANGVYSYKPETVINSSHEMLTHIRKLCSKPTSHLSVRELRELVPPPATAMTFLDELEQKGEIIIMRSLGPFVNSELPKLGRKNFQGLGILDQPGGGGATRMKAVFLDSVRLDMSKKDRPVGRVDDELIWQWADVPIAETDDVIKLLTQEDLTASSQVPEETKAAAAPPAKKKKRANRPLKITNTHMKQQGIDFSKDYVAGQ